MKTDLTRAYNMDCMEFMKDVPDKFYELAIVDPPYGIKRFEKPSGTTRFKSSKMMQEEGLTWDIKPTDEYWSELFRVSKNQIVWGAHNFVLPPSEYFLCWNKQQALSNFATLEYAWVSMGLKKPAKLFTYSIHKHNQVDKVHPTQKPIKLYEWLLMNYAKEGDKILDTHGGSQSSRIACYNLGYALDIIELDKEYFDQGNKRFETHKQQLTLF